MNDDDDLTPIPATPGALTPEQFFHATDAGPIRIDGDALTNSLRKLLDLTARSREFGEASLSRAAVIELRLAAALLGLNPIEFTPWMDRQYFPHAWEQHETAAEGQCRFCGYPEPAPVHSAETINTKAPS